MKTNARHLAMGLALSAMLWGCESRVAGPAATTRGPVFGRGGSDQTVQVEFKRPGSGLLPADFFTAAVTMDLASDPQAVSLRGGVHATSFETKFSPFTLVLEPKTAFYDGKDADNDPDCETGWLTTILDEAAANGGSLDGLLKVQADWDQQNLSNSLFVQFRVQVDPYEYEITVPMAGSPAYDRLVQTGGVSTILAVRNGNFQIRRREIGQKGTWWALQRCLVRLDAGQANGVMDFEVWVTS